MNFFRPHFYGLIVLVAVSFGLFSLAAVVAAPADSVIETQAQLEQELKDVEAQIKKFSDELSKTQSQKKTLINKLNQLQIRQKALTLQIKETTLKLNKLTGQITIVESSIKKNLLKEQQIDDEIADTLREMNAVDTNIIVSLATAEGFSGFFDQLQNYNQLSSSLANLRVQNQGIRTKLTEQQTQLEDQKSDTAELLAIKSIQQKGLLGTIGEQNDLLVQTKGLESNYQTILNDSKKRAAQIRNRIYELFDTGKQITFGEAVDVAKWASGLSGVRPAFLLAILTQESNLGKNVGTCNRVGDPPEKGWKVIMKPTRDQDPFQTITSELALNIDTTPVSCPMRDRKGNQIGWGGAMGPAQFIPSTWMGIRDKVSQLTGKSPANPWDIRDAFLAASVKLKANGADGTDTGDWKAAMRYFSGSTNPQFRFYGDNVLATTKQYLQDIAELK